MRTKWRLLIIVIGVIGILSLLINDAFVVYPETPLDSIRLFKYFTVQSNLVAVLYFLVIYKFKADEKSDKWKNLVGGIMIYTTITFLIFAIVLEGLYTEIGFGMVGSICLHYVNPLLIIGYVIMFRKEFNLEVCEEISLVE